MNIACSRSAPRLAGTWVLLFFADDFTYYWYHRSAHRCRLFWMEHVNHHSSEHYNLSTALRQSTLGPAYTFVFYLPLAFVGFHPLAIAVQFGISLIYQYWIHTEAIDRLGFLEKFMNTPSHHRAHHGSNGIYIDKNYAGILIIWDKLFGTFQEERRDVPVKYGLVHDLKTFSLPTVIFHETAFMLRQVWNAKGWRNKLGWIFGPPEWSPGWSAISAGSPLLADASGHQGKLKSPACGLTRLQDSPAHCRLLHEPDSSYGNAMRFDNQVVMITGAAGLSGKAVAAGFAAVAPGWRWPTSARPCCNKRIPAPPTRLLLPANLLDSASAQNAVYAAMQKFGRLDAPATSPEVSPWAPRCMPLRQPTGKRCRTSTSAPCSMPCAPRYRRCWRAAAGRLSTSALAPARKAWRRWGPTAPRRAR